MFLEGEDSQLEKEKKRRDWSTKVIHHLNYNEYNSKRMREVYPVFSFL